MKMLSNLVITEQRFVLVIDNLGQEKIADKFVCQLLREQGQDEASIKTLPLSNALKEPETFEKFLQECAMPTDYKWNVLLPPLAELLLYQRAAVVLQFLHRLRKSKHVKRTFLWLTPGHVMHSHAQYLLAACEYMADLVLRLEAHNEAMIITRKPGGGVTNKRYGCKRSKTEFLIEPLKRVQKTPATVTTSTAPEQLSTFKIELDEDELVARNALKLPYEKTSEGAAGNIIYTPDADDDFDDEDPDEDLFI